MKYLLLAIAGILVWGMIVNCSVGGTDVSNPPIPTTTRLTSSTLEGAAVRGLRLELALSSNCGRDLESCLTPEKVSGLVYYAGMMVGSEGTGYSVGPIIGDIIDPSVIGSFPQDDLQEFDLGAGLDVDGGIVCCGGSPYPSDDEAIVQSVDIYFAYMDTVFTLEADDNVSQNLIGTHTLRLVLGDIDETDFKKGDVLYKGEADSEFKWCTTEGGCGFTARPQEPIQNQEIASYSGSEDGEGNQTIPTFTAKLAEGHSEIVMTESQVLSNSFSITIDFEMTNGIGFFRDVTKMANTWELADAFRLRAQAGNRDTGFTATVDVEMTPLETP